MTISYCIFIKQNPVLSAHFIIILILSLFIVFFFIIIFIWIWTCYFCSSVFGFVITIIWLLGGFLQMWVFVLLKANLGLLAVSILICCSKCEMYLCMCKSLSQSTHYILTVMFNSKQSLCSETRTCLKFKRVAFVGDSRMRGLFYHLARSLSGKTLGDDKGVCFWSFLYWISSAFCFLLKVQC